MRDYCEMCGKQNKALTDAFNPTGKLMTLCRLCKVGSYAVLAEKVRKYEHEELVARGQVQPIAEEI